MWSHRQLSFIQWHRKKKSPSLKSGNQNSKWNLLHSQAWGVEDVFVSVVQSLPLWSKVTLTQQNLKLQPCLVYLFLKKYEHIAVFYNFFTLSVFRHWRMNINCKRLEKKKLYCEMLKYVDIKNDLLFGGYRCIRLWDEFMHVSGMREQKECQEFLGGVCWARAKEDEWGGHSGIRTDEC